MSDPTRKPLARVMESRDPRSIRFTPTEWARISEEARRRFLEPSVFVRLLTIFALDDVTRSTRLEASLGMTAEAVSGSRRTRRF